MVITKFITDVYCIRYSTLCITDENDIYLWGKSIESEYGHQQEINYYDPKLIYKGEEHIMISHNEEPTVMEKVFGIKDLGFLFTTKLSKIYYSYAILYRTTSRRIWKFNH
jgi:hypothetical protein